MEEQKLRGLGLLLLLFGFHLASGAVSYTNNQQHLIILNEDHTVTEGYIRRLELRIEQIELLHIYYTLLYANNTSPNIDDQLIVTEDFKITLEEIVEFNDTGAEGYDGEQPVSSLTGGDISWNPFTLQLAVRPKIGGTTSNDTIVMHGQINKSYFNFYPILYNAAECKLDIHYPNKQEGTKLAFRIRFTTSLMYQIPTYPPVFANLTGDYTHEASAPFTEVQMASPPFTDDLGYLDVTQGEMVEIGTPTNKEYRTWYTIHYTGTEDIKNFTIALEGALPNIVPYCNGEEPFDPKRKDYYWCYGITTSETPSETTFSDIESSSTDPETSSQETLEQSSETSQDVVVLNDIYTILQAQQTEDGIGAATIVISSLLGLCLVVAIGVMIGVLCFKKVRATKRRTFSFSADAPPNVNRWSDSESDE